MYAMALDLNIQISGQFKNIPSRTQFLEWVKTTLATEKKQHFEITLRIVGTKESSKLNQRYRHQNKATNVLSFSAIMPEQLTYLGDIVICAPLVAKEAKAQHKKITAHWAHLTVHGTLHLLGYDHIRKCDAAIMEPLEIKILHQLGLPNPYVMETTEK
jgi:probable rRNA maturation factor